MRTWCQQHPTFVFCVLVSVAIGQAFFMLYYAAHEMWIWAALSLAVLILLAQRMTAWWERT